MKMHEYMRSFTENEIVEGAEMYFSEEIKIINAVNRRKSDNINATTHVVSGKWFAAQQDGKKIENACEINLNKDRGIIVSTKCTCDTFRTDGYGCKHLAGLLTGFIYENDGDEFFRNSRVESLLKNRASVEDPFVPGVLKKTDNRLLSLFVGDERRNLPVWIDDNAARKEMTIACSFFWSQNSVFLELKAGSENKLRIVKDIKQFIKAYVNRDKFALGKTEYLIAPESFDEQSKKILDYFASLWQAERKGMSDRTLFSEQYGGRYVRVGGRDVDNIMPLLDGGRIEFGDLKDISVELEKKGLSAKINKKAYGISLKIEERKCLLITQDWIYLSDDKNIFRIPLENADIEAKICSLISIKEPLYIRESDILQLRQEILWIFEKYGTIEIKGLALDDYEKEKPKFRFKFDYAKNEGLTCTPFAYYESIGEEITLYDDETNLSKRNAEYERKVADMLAAIFTDFDKASGVLSVDLSDDGLCDFMVYNLDKFEEFGDVYVTDRLKKYNVRKMSEISVGVKVDNGQMLLSLSATGMSDAEMKQILAAYSSKKKYYKVKGGDIFAAGESDSWDTVAELYQHYGSDGKLNKMLVPLYRALYIEEMLGKRTDVMVSGNDEYRALIEKLGNDKEQSVLLPEKLSSQLRGYQNDGVQWICKLKEYGFGGILADDMGLGKTLQVLSFLMSEKKSGKKKDELRTLVICPASLVYNWEKEIHQFTPELDVVVLAGSADERKKLLNDNDADIYVTSYDLLKRDIENYEDIVFANEIIDEAQYIKNQNTQAAKTVRLINSSFKLALTGTPIENHLSELWSIMDYLMPGFLYSYTKFQYDIEVPVVAQKDEAVLERLRKMVHPFILRRLKKEVLKELPDKLEETITVKLKGEQKRLYDANVEQIRQALDKTTAKEFNSSKLQFLSMLTKLRQISCDPAMIFDNYSGESAKLEACIELVNQAIDGGHKVLLFSQFTSMLDIIGRKLTEEKIKYHRLDGSTSKEKRMQMVDSFSSDDTPVFCISLKAGGTGLNLTAADIVIHFDPWWNQAAQNQATDRAHRIGQNQKVTVYEIIAEGTIEEKIQRIKAEKSKLAQDVLSGDQISESTFNRDELLELIKS